MVTIKAGSTPDEYNNFNHTYTTDYARWNDPLTRVPVMRQILEIRSASIIKSYKIKGKGAEKLEKILQDMRGSGKESFKMIIQNLYKIAYICGDAYAVLVNENGETIGVGEAPADMIVLASDNVQQEIENGKIVRYAELATTTGVKHTWEPYQIFHLRYHPRGAQCHGIGVIEPLNNLLLEIEQMEQLSVEIYTRMSKSREIVPVNTDDPTKLAVLNAQIRNAGNDWEGIVLLPAGMIDAENIKTIALTPSLKPQELLAKQYETLFQATATSPLSLGQGYAVSGNESDAKMAGHWGSIRDDQEMCEEAFRLQFICQVFPEGDEPEIEFSYENETRDQSFMRNLQALPIYANLLSAVDPTTGQPIIEPDSIFELIKETLDDMGRVD